MRLVFQPYSESENATDSPIEALRTEHPDDLFKPLKFWHIATHDRKSLVERVIPYMVADISKRHLIQTVIGGYGWSCKIISHCSKQTEDRVITCWQQVVNEFWKDPSRTAKRLLMLVRAWFYTLLRSKYRARFLARGKRCTSDILVGDTNSFTGAQYAAELTPREIHQLIGIPNKYGATFYRSCYKDVQQCSSWKNLCAKISWFCRSIQFPNYLDCPEKILEELRGNLPSIILQRRWFHTATRLIETSYLAVSSADHVKRLDAKVLAESTSNLQRMRRMEQEMNDLRKQCEKMSLSNATVDECMRKIATLTERIAGARASHNTQASKHTCLSLEDIVACRWLLENLPVTSNTTKGFGIQWRSFWQLQWNRYDEKVKSGKHPLRELKCDERFKDIGKNLYSTLSTMVHGYGHLRKIPLHPDVQKMVKVIGPIYYDKDENIDIEAERRRWRTERTDFGAKPKTP